MANEVKNVATIRFRPKDGEERCYEIEVELNGTLVSRQDDVCRLPPTYEGLTFDSPDAAAPDDGVVWRKAGADSEEDFRVSDVAMLARAGSALFEAIFSDYVRGALESRLQDGVALRFDLTRAPKLSQVPFEALFLRGDLFIGTQIRTPISRLLRPDGTGSGGREVIAPARALFAAANPGDTLDQAGEIERIKNIIAKANADVPAIEWTFREGLTRTSFTQALSEVDPDIVHFLGHGEADPKAGHRILFYDEVSPNRAQPVPADEFRRMLQNSGASLIVLNSCGSAQTSSSDVFSGVAQGLIRNRTPFVVAMQTRISDEVAQIFSERFYTEIGRRRTPEEAITIARNAISTVPPDPRRQVEFATPVLYMTGAREALYAPIATGAGAGAADGAVSDDGAGRRRLVKVLAILIGGLLVLLFVVLLAMSGGMNRGAANNTANAPSDTAAAMDDATNAMNAAGSEMENAAASAADAAETAAPSFETARPEMYETAGPRPPFRYRRHLGPLVEISRPNANGHTGHAVPPPPDTPPPPPCPAGWSRDANGVCVAPVVPPPPPPATQTCPNGAVILATEACPAPPLIDPFFVFFDWDKDEITPAAAAILDNAAVAYQATGGGSVTVAGYADRSGPDAYNLGLSQRRADSVRAYLAARGVPDGAIATEAYGESRPLVETADGVREPQNRRVAIVVGPGPG